MVDYGRQKSTVKPESMVLDENSVWVYTNIQAVTETIGDETFTGWQFDMKQYGKDEYITIQAEQITEIQLALVELGGV